MPLDVSDELAIHKLLADYNFAVDAGDGAAFAEFFVADGVLETVGIDTVTGRENLVTFAETVPVMVPGPRHLVTNVSIDGGGDSATCRAYLQMWGTAGGSGSTSLIISGRYDDVLRREDGQWRFVRRTMTPDA